MNSLDPRLTHQNYFLHSARRFQYFALNQLITSFPLIKCHFHLSLDFVILYVCLLSYRDGFYFHCCPTSRKPNCHLDFSQFEIRFTPITTYIMKCKWRKVKQMQTV